MKSLVFLAAAAVFAQQPVDNPNVIQAAFARDGALYAVANPQAAAFVAQLDGALARIAYFTWYGDTGGVTPRWRSTPRDASSFAGTTTARALPATIGQRALAGYTDGFVARFTPDGARLEFATFLGFRSVFVDAGYVHPGGGVGSPDLPGAAFARTDSLLSAGLVRIPLTAFDPARPAQRQGTGIPTHRPRGNH